MERSAHRRIPPDRLIGFVLAGLLWLVWGIDGEAVLQAQKTKLHCQSDMRTLSEAARRYRATQGGKLPRSVGALDGYLKNRLTYHGQNYTCAVSRGRPAPPLCWDSTPHGAPYHLLRWLNAPYRNVLLADGTVHQVSEAQFGALRLDEAAAQRPERDGR